MVKRLVDILLSGIGLLVSLPLFCVIGVWIVLGSKGGVFYRQLRVGRGGEEFGLWKFRTMHTGADQEGLLTLGKDDNRVTGAGSFLRAYKLDELPQLFNVLRGEMSLVGPRPEVRKYVDLYTDEQRKVLAVRPGLTDYASIRFIDEHRLLGEAEDAEKTYVEVIMPAKLNLNMAYIAQMSLLTDIRIILKTVFRILF